MLLFANLAGQFEVTALHCVIAAAFPAPVSVVDPQYNVIRHELLEVATGVQVVIFIVTMRAIVLQLRSRLSVSGLGVRFLVGSETLCSELACWLSLVECCSMV